ncbi:hypothetical protein PF010_g29835 [Phytophthora fragariae]|uniref:Uncharacterized protein n=1 Tax=Phytophthora fragariae TaxID=53985 RepID=A0A6A3PRI2_9STRA|nr:hypothetical protein PF009_g30318 [Phytophthora fragariae]KAE9061392.1 hypothetical protein PF010_g29835 [Phytophthora fragariae]KAE9061615.1 hypothetical protein PF007_g30193 [Phytophthora fragariae]KAE9067796.1 hypothetical protein PF006_g29920 [Phytophthora fragariae]KAE9267824.1 hypothetical protein PF001_g29918 [Phytophthora fragariae]
MAAMLAGVAVFYTIHTNSRRMRLLPMPTAICTDQSQLSTMASPGVQIDNYWNIGSGDTVPVGKIVVMTKK